MAEDLKLNDVERIAMLLHEVVMNPEENINMGTNDLKFLQKYLDSGELNRKVSNLLVEREKQRVKEEMEKQRAKDEAEKKRAEEEMVKKNEAARLARQKETRERINQLLDNLPPQSSSSSERDYSSEVERTTDTVVQVKFLPTANDPRVDFLAFIDDGDAFLMVESQTFPLGPALAQEHLGYPLGVAFDEVSKDWFVCDQANDKILRMNVETEEISVIASELMKNPSAIVIYEEGKSAAVLCAEDKKRNYTIFLYDFGTPSFIRIFATYRDEKYNMKSNMRGLAKSLDRNLLSLELPYQGAKRLKVFKKDIGAKTFDLVGTANPSFIATYRGTVAVSDLGINKVFIYQLDDRYWNEMHFIQTRVIDSQPMPIDRLANESGFAFVSGMQFDVNGFLLIGDAKGHTIKLYDTEYTFLHRISSNFAMPFMSSFHVNSAGDIMMLDVHAAQKLHWGRLKSITEIRPWMGGQNGGGGGGGNGQRRPPYQNNNKRGGGFGGNRR